VESVDLDLDVGERILQEHEILGEISSSNDSLPMISATSRSTRSGSWICLDQPGTRVTRSFTPFASKTRAATVAMSLASTVTSWPFPFHPVSSRWGDDPAGWPG